MVAVLPSKNKFNFLRFDDFAVDIIVVARILQEKGERGFADQIKRSGTSISANISEGNHPQSRADMISKFEIALKEAKTSKEEHNTLYLNK